MKKITLFLIGLLLFNSYLNAQDGLPTASTDDSGPWYYIQVKGTDTARANRVFTVVENESKTEQDLVMGLGKDDVTSLDDIYSRLWRFEKTSEGIYVIVNRKTDKILNYWSWAAKDSKYMAVAENTAVEWKLEAPADAAGYFKIIANLPEDADPATAPTATPYLHQGNSGWDFAVIMEVAQWGNGADSYFQFVEYPGDPDLTVDKETIDFGCGVEGNGGEDDLPQDIIPSYSITVFGFPKSGVIEYSLDNEENFVVMEESGWGANGGKLTAWYYPGPVGVQTGTLTVTMTGSEGLVTKTVALKGTAISKLPVVTSPTVEAGSNDAWYYIWLPKRTGNYVKDYGADQMLGTVRGIDENDPGHLWKFVPVPGKEDAYYVVSKSGHQLDYKTTEKVDEETGTTSTISRFYSTETTDNTFSIVARNDGNYQLRWNEYMAEIKDEDGNPTGEFENKVTYINKTNPSTDDGYTAYNSVTDAGNAMQFVKYGSNDYIKLALDIEFSTADDPIWYYITFYRNSSKRFTSNGLGNTVTQTAFNSSNPTAYYWRFEEGDDENTVKIFDYDGYAFPANPSGVVALVEGEGEEVGSYLLEQYEETEDFTLKSSNYLNDFGQANVGGYGSLDGGARIFFFKAENGSVGIDKITPEDIDNGDVVAKVYYTLQGIQLTGTPTAEGLYIVKTIYTNNKATAKTIYLTK